MKSIALFLAATFSFLYSHAQSTFGCTDPTACNFKSNATIDDGLCLFAGTTCDDGNPLTRYDRMDSDCQCAGFTIQTDCADEIFISEYVEGTSNNKAIELYNPTSEPISLDGIYSMGRDRDGAGNPMLMNITGTIEPLGVRVFALDKRDPNGTGTEIAISPLLEAVADTFLNPVYVQSNSPMYFTGDDAFVLVKNGTQIIDIVGKIGEDPGGGWSQPGDPATRWWTQDNTMIRKPEVLSGVTINPDVFDPSLEWDTLAVNDFSHLGWHQTNCAQDVAGCIDPTACNFNSFATTNDGSCVFPGTSCNDGNASTLYDQLDENCECAGFVIQTDCADEIFISEYVEGTSNNKAIELYNPTSEPILLDGVYSMGRDRDGAGNPMLMNITGTIEPLGVRVFALDKRDPNGTGTEIAISPLLEAVADTFLNPVYVQSNSPMYFTGDDAFVLVKNGTQIIDIVGKIGEDPGSGWSQPGDPNTRWWTTNHTMIRKPEILNGVTVNPDVFDPSLEWDTLSVDDFSHLGWHEINCNPVVAGCLNSNACNYNSLASISDGSCYFIGDACNDNDSATSDDVIQSDCNCAGSSIDPGCLGLNVDYTFSNPTCFGQYNGSIDIQVTGGSGNYLYQWSSQNSCLFFGATTEDLNNLTACQYSVNVVDQDSGCEVSATITLDQPAIMDLMLDLSTYPGGTNVSCFNSNDGTLSVIVTGGTPDPIAFAPNDYLYNWDADCFGLQVINPVEFGNDTNSPYLTNLPAGFYGLEVTDANGCLVSTCFDLVAPDPILPPNTEIIGLNVFEPFSVQTYSVSQLSNVSYEWSVTGGNILQGQGSNFIQVQWANNSIGTINLVITTSNGCQTMLDFVVESALEVNENDNSFIEWSAFPNPASDMVTIQLTGTTKPIDYRLLDATGRIISRGQINEGLNNLSISHLSSGIYTIELQPAFSTLHRQQLIVE